MVLYFLILNVQTLHWNVWDLNADNKAIIGQCTTYDTHTLTNSEGV
jgi:hypothetical protein